MVLTDHFASLNEQFLSATMCPEDRIDLVHAALLISRLAYPDLDEPFYLAELEELGRRLRAMTEGLGDAGRIAQMMARLLCEEEGFRGNSKDYYDPDNSYLNRVLDRRTGSPISLCLVYMEVGRRAGLSVRGIGMPGHFIAGLYSGGRRCLVDPFHCGVVLDEEECRRRVAVQHGGFKPFGPRLLDPAPPKRMLVRLLRNLRGIYTHRSEGIKSFQIIEWIVALDPHAADEYKMRGYIYEGMGAFDLAVRDMEKYLSLTLDPPDAQAIHTRIEELGKKTSRLH
ncbi:MAG: transglutaminase-like domain-containing protein [Syntrophobacteraceae bacterium]|nr:transglutaminase-like domain-containing protein [Syntrophobacteraceae bacterium]